MKRSIQRSRHDLEDSWVIEEDGHDGSVNGNVKGKNNNAVGVAADDSDYTDDSDNEGMQYKSRLATRRTSPRKRVSKRVPTEIDSNHVATPRASRVRRSPRHGLDSGSIEPELVYPSIQQSKGNDSWVAGSGRSSLGSSAAHLSKRNHMASSIKSSASISEAPQSTPAGRSAYRIPARQKPQATNSTYSSDEDNILNTLWKTVMAPVLSFIFSVFARALQALKTPLAYGLAIWILFGLGVMVRNLVTSSISSAVSPLCRVPGASYLNLPFCSTYQPAAPVEFNELMTVQSAFEDVLTTSAGGATLPLDMKRSEASIRDLKHVVKFSHLPSRNELVFEFTGFIETARQASGDLTRFNSRIGRAVDHILSINRWTLQVLDGVSEEEASRGSITTFFAENILAPFQPVRLTEHILLEQYLRHTRAVEDQIVELIVEAQALLGILQNLDDRLDVIAEIAARDGVSTQGSRDELLATLWTKLGGNRSTVSKLNEQLQLLKHVGHYRKMAWAHVSGTILKLQSIAAGLEDLRERVAGPEVVGIRDEIPLKLHIENIKLGVDRLEAQRQEARRLEGENYQRVLDKTNGFGKDRMIDGGRTVTVAAA